MVPAAPHCMASTAVCAGFQSERSSIRYTAWAQPSRRRAARRAGGGRRGGGTHRRTRRESRSPRPRSGHRARARRRGSGRRARARARSGSPVRPPAGSYARARLATAETVKLLPPLCLAPVEPPANRARRVGAAEWQCAGNGSPVAGSKLKVVIPTPADARSQHVSKAIPFSAAAANPPAAADPDPSAGHARGRGASGARACQPRGAGAPAFLDPTQPSSPGSYPVYEPTYAHCAPSPVPAAGAAWVARLRASCRPRDASRRSAWPADMGGSKATASPVGNTDWNVPHGQAHCTLTWHERTCSLIPRVPLL